MNKDFARGMIVSMALKALPVRKKSPIAYLYNGVRLPALPEWDREMYPYAYIWDLNADFPSLSHYYKLTIMDTPLRYGTVNGVQSIYCAEGRKTAMYNLIDGAWVYYGESSGSNRVTANPIWTNHDVINDTDGSVYLSGSNPIPIYNEPVNYLYNGVKLPKLPEWDKTVYPYAAISSSGKNSYYLRLLRYDAQYQINSWGDFAFKSTPALTSNYTASSGWGDFTENSSGAYISPTYSETVSVGVRWTNFDLLNEDGTVFMEASEPIPVYE